MSRRLRHIDDAGEIKRWVEAMAAINGLLKEVDIKNYTDNWKPWRVKETKEKEHRVSAAMETEREEGLEKKEKILQMLKPKMDLNMDIDGDEPALGDKKRLVQLMPPLRSPIRLKPEAPEEPKMTGRSTTKGKRGIKDFGEEMFVDNDERVKEKTPTKEEAKVHPIIKESKSIEELQNRRTKSKDEETCTALRSTVRRKLREDGKNLDWDNTGRAMWQLIRELGLKKILEENQDKAKVFREEVVAYKSMTSKGGT